MVDFAPIITQVLSVVFKVTSAVIKVGISVTVWLSHDYPGLLNAILAILGGVLLFKMGRRVVNIWLSFIVAAFKFFVINVTLLSLVYVWIRGPDTVINHDIPMVVSFAQSANPDNLAAMAKGAQLFANAVPRGQERATSEKVEEYYNEVNEKLDSDEQLSFEEVSEMVNQGWDYLQDAGVDWSKVGTNMLDYLVNQAEQH